MAVLAFGLFLLLFSPASIAQLQVEERGFGRNARLTVKVNGRTWLEEKGQLSDVFTRRVFELTDLR